MSGLCKQLTIRNRRNTKFARVKRDRRRLRQRALEPEEFSAWPIARYTEGIKMKIDSKDFRVRPGEKVDLGKWPTTIEPVYNSKKQYRKLLEKHVEKLSSQQQLHYTSNRYAFLLIFQGGMRNQEIALKLNLSEHTVRNYLLRIFDKLGISSRVELVLYAFSGVEGSAASPG
jgi:DNA-binding CsgD family transcriptional regulator